MNTNLKVLLLIIILLASTALAMMLIGARTSLTSTRTPYQINPADIELYYVARTVLSSINIVLLIALIVNYFSIYLKTKSDFTVGLLFFAAFFLIKDITWSPFVIGWFGFGLFGLGPFAFLPDLFELVALSVLLYMSVKY